VTEAGSPVLAGDVLEWRRIAVFQADRVRPAADRVKPDRRTRRDVQPSPPILPAEGRRGDPPTWPLPGEVSAEETQAWRALWATPHAVAWERLAWTRTVARYRRAMVRAESPDASAAILGQVASLEDRLGVRTSWR
jgi:hypothetical protein